jgi:hypothetical protein
MSYYLLALALAKEDRESYYKPAAFARHAIHFQPALMSLHDLPALVQADSQAPSFGGAKGAEQLGNRFVIHPAPVILHRQCDGIVVGFSSDCDRAVSTHRFPGIED